jgi:hypothetical protein
MKHAWYNESTNQWVSENCAFNSPGHIYDCIGYDHSTGIGYIVPGGGSGDDKLWKSTWTKGQPLERPTVGSSSAGPQIPTILYAGNDHFVSGSSAMDWHPNLFGPGDGGMVVVCQRGIAGFRKSTYRFHIIVSGASVDHPVCVYSRGLDAIIACNGNTVYKIDDYQTWISSADPGLDPAPVDFSFDHGGAAVAALVDDPLGRPTLYALEKGSGGRVWKYNRGAWDLQSFRHPFTARDNNDENWMVAAMYGHGCIWALEQGPLPTSRIWRPNDIPASISRMPAVNNRTNTLTVSPNPYSSGALAVRTSVKGVLQILDVRGRLLYQSAIAGNTVIPGSRLAGMHITPGMVFVRVRVKDGRFVQKPLLILR